jgi:hypothetical protein
MTTLVVGDNTGNTAGTEDTQIKEGSATTNFATTTPLEVTHFGAGDWSRMLLRFTGLSGIPAGSTVLTVVPSIYHQNTSGDDNTVIFSIYKSLRNWVLTQATWNIYSTGNNWTTAGGMGSGDAAGTASANANSLATGGSAGYIDFASTAQLVADVQSWVDGSQNNGWIIDRSDAGGQPGDSKFTQITSEEGTDGQRPYITVTYTPPAGSVAVTAWFRA